MLPKLKRIFKDYLDAGALRELVSIEAAIDERTFVTKGGGFATVLGVEGIDSECLTSVDLEQITRRIESSHKTLDESYRVYHYLLKRPFGSIPQGEHGNAVVREATASRAAYLDGKKLFQTEIILVIVYEGWRVAQRTAGSRLQDFASTKLGPLFSSQTKVASLENSLNQACQILADKVDRFVAELSAVAKAEVLNKHEAFRFFYGLLNFAPQKRSNAELRYDQFVDYQLCDSTLECHRDHLRIDNDFVQVFTLKEPPAQTIANLLKDLSTIPCSFIVATEWKRTSNAAMRSLIQSKRRHFHNSKVSAANYVTGSNHAPHDTLIDSSAAALVGNLGACLEEMDIHGRYFGQFSLTIVLYSEDRAALSRAVTECHKVCAGVDVSLTEERYNALNAFLSVLPGNDAFNVRRAWLLNVNYADLALLFAPQQGEPHNQILNSEYLAVLETNQATPYFFNPHCGDVAHALVSGSTGSGKSFWLNFILTHAQKYNPRTFICDLGGSYASLTRLFGGTYVHVNLEKPSFSINPFSLSPTPENRRFLLLLIRVLVESSGYQMTAQDERDVYEQIGNLYSVDPEQRRLHTLANILSRPLREQLAQWVKGGPYAAVFDNVEDNLTFAHLQTFDFEGMDKVPHLLEPLLFYILHRANSVIYDPELATTFKIFIVDEAWRLFRHPVIRHYIQEALKTWRKKNGAMILATQSGEDLLKSEMLPVVVESCATKIFLANPGMDERTYREMFHLNETETALIARLIPKQQMLIQRPDGSKVVNLNVDPKGYWIYTNNPFDNQKKREAFDRFGFERGLDELTRSHS